MVVAPPVVAPQPPVPPVSDDELLGALLDAHRQSAFNLAYRLVRRPEDAADAVQDAFVLAVRAARGDTAAPREAGRFRSWLLKIVANVALSRLRRKRADAASLDDLAAEPADPRAEQPLAALERRERRGDVLHALLVLPDTQRAALTLREYQGLSYDEIGDALGLDRAATTALLYRARCAFRRAYEGLAERPERSAARSWRRWCRRCSTRSSTPAPGGTSTGTSGLSALPARAPAAARREPSARGHPAPGAPVRLVLGGDAGSGPAALRGQAGRGRRRPGPGRHHRDGRWCLGRAPSCIAWRPAHLAGRPRVGPAGRTAFQRGADRRPAPRHHGGGADASADAVPGRAGHDGAVRLGSGHARGGGMGRRAARGRRPPGEAHGRPRRRTRPRQDRHPRRRLSASRRHPTRPRRPRARRRPRRRASASGDPVGQAEPPRSPRPALERAAIAAPLTRRRDRRAGRDAPRGRGAADGGAERANAQPAPARRTGCGHRGR